MDNNNQKNNVPAASAGTSRPSDGTGTEKRRRSHRGGRKHHSGHRPDATTGTQTEAQAKGSTPGTPATPRQTSQSRNQKPNRQNAPRRPDGVSGDRRDEQRRPERGGRPDRPNYRKSEQPSIRPSGIEAPVRSKQPPRPFPFQSETDQDPAAVTDTDLPELTAENYLDTPLCFAGKTPIAAVPTGKNEETTTENATEATSAFAMPPVTEIIGVRFRGAGKVYSFAPGSVKATVGSYVIVDTVRGPEYGEVMVGNRFVPASEVVAPLRAVLRAANESDRLHDEDNRRREAEAFRICRDKIAEHKLDMKLVDAQYTFDNSKLLFYFTSDGRVDFRDLVKNLAGVFRTRIELRQIGIRDEAKLLGGLGVCGRPLCCTSFLADFGQVSIKMAKEQNLSLNSAKISGVCGRLMCCLRYEYDVYVDETKKTPSMGTLVRTADGIGRVTAVNPLAGTVRVFLTESPDVPQKTYHRDNVEVLQRGDGTRYAGRRTERTSADGAANASAAPDQNVPNAPKATAETGDTGGKTNPESPAVSKAPAPDADN